MKIYRYKRPYPSQHLVYYIPKYKIAISEDLYFCDEENSLIISEYRTLKNTKIEKIEVPDELVKKVVKLGKQYTKVKNNYYKEALKLMDLVNEKIIIE